MPVYAYTALDATGHNLAGRTTASNRQVALDLLAHDGLIPISVEEQAASAAAAVDRPADRAIGRVKPVAAEAFVRELSNLLTGGVPLSRGLLILSREASSAPARRQWAGIHDDVVGGLPLAEAMARWPRTFSPVQIAMVRAGETGGFLETVLAQIAEFRARERDLLGKVKAALVYPAILAIISCVVVVFLLTFFIPRMSRVFAGIGGQLPVLTQGILAASNVLTQYGLWVLAGLVVAIVLIRRALRSQSGRRLRDRTLLRTPAVGRVLAQFALVRFCRMLGTLLTAGVGLVTALKVAREAIGNQTLADAVGGAIDEVQRGTPLARSLAACPELFPSSVAEVIAVAEESGRLGVELVRLANTHESELDRRLRMLVTLAEPVMLFVMAILVGTIVIGMLLPVFTLQEYIH